MTSTMRRPHTSCGIRKPQCVTLRHAWGKNNCQSFTRTSDAPIFLSEREEIFTRDEKTNFKSRNDMEDPITSRGKNIECLSSDNDAQNITTPVNGRCKGVKSHGLKDGLGLKDPDYFYLTTNRKEFDGKQGLSAPMARPKSSKFYPSENKFLRSLYQEEYCGKHGQKEPSSQRSGTSSGNRKNKPHPLQSFMIWKFPGQLPPLGKVHDINEEIMHKVTKESFKTTYEVDYTLYRQGSEVKEKLNDFYPIMKSDKPPYTLDSTSRFEYQQPQLHGNLKNNTSRYGCNARRQNPAIGAVPNIAANVPNMLIHGKTLYSQEFRDKSDHTKASNIQRPNLNLQKYRHDKKDNANIERLLKKLADLEESREGPTHLSDWAGPR